MFHGSYLPTDVTFLLKPVDIPSTDIAEKEVLIQSGQRHYSEMITRESLPSQAYLDTFHEGLKREQKRFAHHLLVLAQQIHLARPQNLALVSLARAGTPIGVLLTRILRSYHQRELTHYSISIIRDRGIDAVALQYIVDLHGPEAIVFIDGWTGKGVIARELHESVSAFNAKHQVNIDDGLFTVADLCGHASVAATSEDYLIPSCVLGATISGLVSRSILNSDVVGPGDFHGCLFYEEFIPEDLSGWFIEEVLKEVSQIAQAKQAETKPALKQEDFLLLREKNLRYLSNMQERFAVRNINHIKPGIGEATRVLLRRVPHLLLLHDPNRPEVQHLLQLAREKQVPVRTDAGLPYLATALIRELE